jgi:hypothetical protein
MNPLWDSNELDRMERQGPPDAADEAMLSSLRDALRPAPLPAALVRRIESGWVAPRDVPLSMRLAWLRPALAAAALATLFFIPSGVRSGANANQIVLTEEETQLMLAAFAAGRWYAPCDAAIDRLSENVDRLSEQVQPGSEGDRSDEWDFPRTRPEPASPGSSRTPDRSRVVS